MNEHNVFKVFVNGFKNFLSTGICFTQKAEIFEGKYYWNFTYLF